MSLHSHARPSTSPARVLQGATRRGAIADYERAGELKFGLLVWRANLRRDASLADDPQARGAGWEAGAVQVLPAGLFSWNNGVVWHATGRCMTGRLLLEVRVLRADGLAPPRPCHPAASVARSRIRRASAASAVALVTVPCVPRPPFPLCRSWRRCARTRTLMR